jgi:hypothetical protein
VLSRGRATGRPSLLASLSHRAGSDGPLYLPCIPLAATGRRDSLPVESLGDINCSSNASLAQRLDGCHGEFFHRRSSSNNRLGRPSEHASTRAGKRVSRHEGLSIAANGIPMASTIFDRTQVRLDQPVVRPYAGLRVNAPILIVDSRLSVRVHWRFLGELILPDEPGTDIPILAVEAHGVREHGKVLHGSTPAG